MDNTTTIIKLEIANPNDTNDSQKKILIIGYSNGETDFLTYDGIEEKIAEIEKSIEDSQGIIDAADIKRALLETAKQRCNDELGIADTVPSE